MNSVFLSSINNSRAAYEPFIETSGYGTQLSVFPHYLEGMQSSSVTPSGLLWLQTLARMANDAHFTVSQSDIKDKELHPSAAQRQKNRALIQLLKSWREGDEQEQHNTWEYLKQALDEDRISERKLFP